MENLFERVRATQVSLDSRTREVRPPVTYPTSGQAATTTEIQIAATAIVPGLDDLRGLVALGVRFRQLSTSYDSWN